jgi:hypothetical protein
VGPACAHPDGGVTLVLPPRVVISAMTRLPVVSPDGKLAPTVLLPQLEPELDCTDVMVALACAVRGMAAIPTVTSAPTTAAATDFLIRMSVPFLAAIFGN